MTQSASKEPIQQKKRPTGALGQGKLEQLLRDELKAGPARIHQQVRYILALSQLSKARPITDPVKQSPLTVAAARYDAIIALADTLSDQQKRALLGEIQQVEDTEHRLLLTLQLLTSMPYTIYRGKHLTFAQQIHRMTNPIKRTQAFYRLAELSYSVEALAEPTDAKNNPLARSLQIAEQMNNADARVRSLVALSVYLSEGDRKITLEQLLDDVNASSIDSLRANAISAMADYLPEALEEKAYQCAIKIRSHQERVRALTALAQHTTSAIHSRIEQQTLETIAQINSEDDRTTALVNFAPHLEASANEDEFPQLLESALSVAVSVTRRHLRAKALVALAPHLTSDLQGEALAAVHSLSNERERALMLAELAPNLPPDMLVASLAVAHTMREQDSRVHALTILAHYVPPQARSQTVLDALAAAANLPHHFERVTALVRLVDILPEQLLDQALTNALETTRLIENASARSRAFSLLGNHLPKHLLSRALQAAYQIEDPQQRLSALTGMIENVPLEDREEALHHMLECVQQTPFDYKRARALVSIAPHLTPTLIPDVLALADQLTDPFDQASAYIALAHNIAPDQRPALIQKAWEQVQRIEDGYDQSSALASIAPYLPEEIRSEVARMAIRVVTSIEDEYDQASAISILAVALASEGELPTPPKDRLTLSQVIEWGLKSALSIPEQAQRSEQLSKGVDLWQALDPDTGYEIWCSLAPVLFSLPLPDVLRCLGKMMPVFEQISGSEGIKSIAQTLGVR